MVSVHNRLRSAWGLQSWCWRGLKFDEAWLHGVRCFFTCCICRQFWILNLALGCAIKCQTAVSGSIMALVHCLMPYSIKRCCRLYTCCGCRCRIQKHDEFLWFALTGAYCKCQACQTLLNLHNYCIAYLWEIACLHDWICSLWVQCKVCLSCFQCVNWMPEVSADCDFCAWAPWSLSACDLCFQDVMNACTGF